MQLTFLLNLLFIIAVFQIYKWYKKEAVEFPEKVGLTLVCCFSILFFIFNDESVLGGVYQVLWQVIFASVMFLILPNPIYPDKLQTSVGLYVASIVMMAHAVSDIDTEALSEENLNSLVSILSAFSLLIILNYLKELFFWGFSLVLNTDVEEYLPKISIYMGLILSAGLFILLSFPVLKIFTSLLGG